jgi:hypothetical protein
MRSHEILNNWAPSLREALAVLQWVMKGTKSLIYIPVDDGECLTQIAVFESNA